MNNNHDEEPCGKCDICMMDKYIKMVDEATPYTARIIAYAWVLMQPPGEFIERLFGPLFALPPDEREHALRLSADGKGPLARGNHDKGGVVPDATQRVIVPPVFYKDE